MAPHRAAARLQALVGTPRVNAAVDVIVPVYRGELETRACLESVLAASTNTSREVVVVDDASPEPTIRAWLRPDRDVVLLNSDTEVAPGWLDRLAGHARGDPSIGTTTPFSNNATICSYPHPHVDNPLPPGETTATLDQAFASANPRLCADIPTAVGFCMFISRRCLDATGPFDEARYGAGYGEEVDFCMRAARAGFRNVCAGDVFVRHVGEVSFQGAGEERRERAQAIVDELYPEFKTRLYRHLAQDPLKPMRRRVDAVLLRGAPGALAGLRAAARRLWGKR